MPSNKKSNMSNTVESSESDEEKSNRIFVKRRLHLVRCEKDGDDYTKQSRTVTHFHYVAWPDFGVPETPDEFAQFFDLLHEHRCFTDPDRPRYSIEFLYKVGKNSFSIVHCSAGIGRTGTLILVDSLLKKLRKEGSGTIDLYHIVQIAFDEIIRLRQYRMGLIQVLFRLVNVTYRCLDGGPALLFDTGDQISS